MTPTAGLQLCHSCLVKCCRVTLFCKVIMSSFLNQMNYNSIELIKCFMIMMNVGRHNISFLKAGTFEPGSSNT